MKRLITILLLAFCFSTEAQTFTSLFDTISVNASFNMLVKRPRTQAVGVKYPVFWFMGGNGEYGTISAAYNVGPFRIMTGGAGSPQQSAYSVTDSMWIVQVVPTGSGGVAQMEQPNTFFSFMDKFDAVYGFSHQDTTRYCLSGISQGGINAIEMPTWPTGTLGFGFGDPANYRNNRFKMFVESSMCALRGSNRFDLLTGKIVRLFHAAVDGTCSPGFSTSTFSSIAPYVTNRKYTAFTGTFGHDNNTWDSAFSARGVDSAHNIFLLFYGLAGTPVVYTDTVLMVRDIISLSSYAGVDPNTPYNFFDSRGLKRDDYLVDNKGVVDPLNGITSDTTSVGNAAHGWDNTKGAPLKDDGSYFADTLGSFNGIKTYKGTGTANVIFDFAGYKGWNDTSYQSIIKQIWVMSGENNTLRFYNVDSFYMRKSVANRPVALARFDSLATQVGSITLTGDNHSWLNINVNTKCRYLLMTMEHDPTHHISNAYEIVFYGTQPVRDVNKIRVKDTTSTRINTPFNQKIGGNVFVANMVAGYRDAVVRGFGDNSAADTTKAQGIPLHYVDIYQLYPDANYAWLDSLKLVGIRQTSTQQNASAYGTSRPGTHFNKMNLLDTLLDPRLPSNWQRAGDMAYQYALLLGSGTTGDANSKWPTGTVLHRNRGVDGGVPFGNETIAHGANVLALASKKSVESDGWEGRIGASGKTGTKNADVNFIRNMDADVHFNIHNAKALNFLWATQRTDSTPPIDIYEVHDYFTDRDSLPRVSLDNNIQVGVRTEVPAKVYSKSGLNMVTYWNKLANQFYTYYPKTIKLAWTENGISNWGTQTTNAGQTGTQHDLYTSFPIPQLGYDSLKTKAAILNQIQLLAPFLQGMDYYNEYVMENSTNVPANQEGQFAAHGRAADHSAVYPFPLTGKFAAYYIRSCTWKTLYGYKADSLFMGDTSATIWRVKYRSVAHPDSVIWAAWKPSILADSSSVSIALPGLSNITELKQSFTTETLTSTNVTASAGAVNRRLTLLPTFYAGTETASPPSCTTNNTTTSITATSAVLNWNAASGATGYDIYFNGSYLTTVSVTSYNKTGLTGSTTYSYYVVPTNSSGSASGCSGSATSFTTAFGGAWGIWNLYRGNGNSGVDPGSISAEDGTLLSTESGSIIIKD